MIIGCATCLHTRNHLIKEVGQKRKKQQELLIQKEVYVFPFYADCIIMFKISIEVNHGK